MPSAEDSAFAQLAMDRGLVSREVVDECRRAVEADSQDAGPARLSDVLQDKGWLSKAQVRELYRQLHQRGMYPRIGQYEIMLKLGQGAMGRVYKARHVDTGRVVALKVLPRRFSRNERFLERFSREAQAMIKLHHENIVQGFDVGEADGYHYFAMEYVEGRTVKDLMLRHGPIDEEQALRVALQVARALQHANELGIVHRDVKPSNIMISPDGMVKLCDLGLVKETASEQDLNLTITGVAVGTAYYISPEQARGLPDIDIRSDIYSLGATLYHMLVGEVPFVGSSPAVVMTKHVTDDAPSPKEHNLALSDHVCNIVEKMMAKEPDRRYQTPEELIEDLELALEGRLPEASLSAYLAHDSTAEAAAVTAKPKPAGRRGRRLAVHAVMAASIIASLAFLAWNVVAAKRKARQQVQAVKLDYAKRLYRHADRFATEHPHDYRLVLGKLEMVAEVAADTDYGRQAAEKADTVKRRLDAAAEPVFRRLEHEADKLLDDLQFAKALKVWDRFPDRYAVGQWARKTEQAKARCMQAARTHYKRLAARAQDFIASGNFAAAIETYRSAEAFDIPEISAMALAAVRETKSKQKRARALRLFRDAVQAYRNGQYHTAQARVKVLSAVYPEFQFTSNAVGGEAMTLAELKGALADKGSVIVVRQDGGGDYTTIRSALAAAQPGDVVEIRDGSVYNEPGIGCSAACKGCDAMIVAKADITLRGAGARPTIVSGDAKPGHYLICCGPNWRLEGIDLAFSNGVYAARGPVTMVNCQARPRAGVCVRLEGAFGKATIENCVFRNADAVVELGAVSLPSAEVVFRHNVAYSVKTVFSRVAASTGVSVTVSDSIFADVKQSVILDRAVYDTLRWAMDGNCYWQAASFYEGRLGGSRVTIPDIGGWRAKNGTDRSSISSDPELVCAKRGDFSLSAHSPCRGAGLGGADIGLILPAAGAQQTPAAGRVQTIGEANP